MQDQNQLPLGSAGCDVESLSAKKELRLHQCEFRVGHNVRSDDRIPLLSLNSVNSLNYWLLPKGSGSQLIPQVGVMSSVRSYYCEPFFPEVRGCRRRLVSGSGDPIVENGC